MATAMRMRRRRARRCSPAGMWIALRALILVALLLGVLALAGTAMSLIVFGRIFL